MKKYGILTLLAFLFIKPLWAQDGEKLFQAKCNTCHMVDKNSTGPLLKGVKQKWEDAGEGELLYDWVHNSKTLILSGKSKMAAAIRDYSPTEMPAQNVSNEEIDAILSYIDSYAPETGPPPGEVIVDPVLSKPDYEQNLNLFYALLVATVVLLFAIILISRSITTLVRSDYFREKLEEQSKDRLGLKAIITIITLGSLLFANPARALTFVRAGETSEKTPWLLVEAVDIYVLILVNMILLGVLVYLRRLFNGFMRMAVPPKEKPVEKPAGETFRKIGAILTDVVPVEEEEKILMDHEYDGIHELDNNLPPWWVWGFYISIAFAVVYLFNYHVLKTSDLQLEAYNRDMKQAQHDIDAYLAEMAMNVDETNATVLTEGSDISAGKSLFQNNCIACHNPNGEGNIGPNLTDDYWIYGPDVKDLFKTIKKGTSNGMPEHASKLNPVQIQQVASFVLSLPFKEGKEPQGTRYEENRNTVD